MWNIGHTNTLPLPVGNRAARQVSRVQVAVVGAPVFDLDVGHNGSHGCAGERRGGGLRGTGDGAHGGARIDVDTRVNPEEKKNIVEARQSEGLQYNIG